MNSCKTSKLKKSGRCTCGPNQGAADATTPAPDETEVQRTVPTVDIIEADNEFLILADMPGAVEDSIDVSFNSGELTLSAEVEENGQEEDVVCRCRQFEPNDYFRMFRIGDSIDADQISADYKDGVLTVRLPKKAELEPRKIAVNKK